MSQKLYQPFHGTPRVTQHFGGNASYYAQFGQVGHNGIDYGMPSGTPIRAAADGTVDFEGWGDKFGLAGKPAGIYVLLEHNEGWTGYAHLNRTVVNKGQKVTRGQVIAYSGASGAVTGAHLHFERFPNNYNLKNGYYGRIDPQPELNMSIPKPPVVEPPKPPVDLCPVQLIAEKALTKALTGSNNELIEQNNELVDELADNNEENKQLLLDNQALQMELEECRAGETKCTLWVIIKRLTNIFNKENK